MSRAEVEQIDDRGLAAWDQHDAAAFTALLADDFTFSDVMAPEAFTTREQVQEYMESWFTAFPDMRAK
ncbi:MAG: nuclear transport factor 2 family protein, partial [Actinomycetes bacterium]